jgi:hypothetical protein
LPLDDVECLVKTHLRLSLGVEWEGLRKSLGP